MIAYWGKGGGTNWFYQHAVALRLPPIRHVAAAVILLMSARLDAASPALLAPESPDYGRVAAALPTRATAKPAKPRRLLVFDLNVNYGGHRSAAFANQAFLLLGQKTGAFEAEISGDPEIFRSESLARFDAVFFNNNVGNLFTNADLRESLVDFVYGGGGLMGVHGTSVAFTRWPGAHEDWPEFGRMLGGRGASHREANEHAAIKLDDPEHPLNACFGGQGFEYRSEFFRVGPPYSRDRLRVLFSFDNEKTSQLQGRDLGKFRADEDYALAWVRNYGRGRTLYCTIAHNPEVFCDPLMLKFYLGAAQFVLGDLAAPTLPSARLTPAAQALERLGWRTGLEPDLASGEPLSETIVRAGKFRIPFINAAYGQPLEKGSPKKLAPPLSAEDRQALRFRLDDAGVRLLGLRLAALPSAETELRDLFRFARRMGAEMITVAEVPASSDLLIRLMEENQLRVVVDNRLSPHLPSRQMAQMRAQNRLFGVALSANRLNAAMRLSPPQVAQHFEDRLALLEIGNLQEADWIKKYMAQLLSPRRRPELITLGPSSAKADTDVELQARIEFLDRLALELTKTDK